MSEEVKEEKKEEEYYSTLSIEDEGGGEGGEDWLVSYADMMTLIACFFIVMMAFANYDKPTFKRMSQEVGKYFNGANLQAKQDDKTSMVNTLQAIIQSRDEMMVRNSMEGIEIRFNSGYLFDLGSADLRPEIISLMNVLVEIVKTKNKNFIIEAHGHTDNIPLTENNRFKNNWELSGARAGNIIEEFSRRGFPSKNLVSIGYGPSRPEVPNENEQGERIPENQARNRRVVVLIKDPPEPFKLGFGTILNVKKDNGDTKP